MTDEQKEIRKQKKWLVDRILELQEYFPRCEPVGKSDLMKTPLSVLNLIYFNFDTEPDIR